MDRYADKQMDRQVEVTQMDRYADKQMDRQVAARLSKKVTYNAAKSKRETLGYLFISAIT